MAILEIVKVPHPVLREKAKKVPKVTPAIRNCWTIWPRRCGRRRVSGLAAPQVGILQRVIVVEVKKDEDDPHLQTGFYQLINPEIVGVSKEVEEGPEGCLIDTGLHRRYRASRGN